jgi:hypothetical protein
MSRANPLRIADYLQRSETLHTVEAFKTFGIM